MKLFLIIFGAFALIFMVKGLEMMIVNEFGRGNLRHTQGHGHKQRFGQKHRYGSKHRNGRNLHRKRDVAHAHHNYVGYNDEVIYYDVKDGLRGQVHKTCKESGMVALTFDDGIV